MGVVGRGVAAMPDSLFAWRGSDKVCSSLRNGKALSGDNSLCFDTLCIAPVFEQTRDGISPSCSCVITMLKTEKGVEYFVVFLGFLEINQRLQGKRNYGHYRLTIIQSSSQSCIFSAKLSLMALYT